MPCRGLFTKRVRGQSRINMCHNKRLFIFSCEVSSSIIHNVALSECQSECVSLTKVEINLSMLVYSPEWQNSALMFEWL